MKRIVALLLSFAFAFGTVSVYAGAEEEIPQAIENMPEDEAVSPSAVSSDGSAEDSDEDAPEIESYRFEMPDRGNMAPPPEIQKIMFLPRSEEAVKLMEEAGSYEYPVKDGKLSAEVKDGEVYVNLSGETSEMTHMAVIVSQFDYDGKYKSFISWGCSAQGTFSIDFDSYDPMYESFVPSGTSSSLSVFAIEVDPAEDFDLKNPSYIYFNRLKPVVKPIFLDVDPSGNVQEKENSVEDITEATTEDPAVSEAKNYVSSLKTSNYEDQWFKFEIDGNYLNLTGKDAASGNKHYILHVIKADEADEDNWEIQKDFSKGDDSELSLSDVDIDKLEDGVYSIKVFGSKNAMSSHLGVMEVKMVINDGEAYLINYYDVLSNNTKIRGNAERTHNMDYWIGDNYRYFTTSEADAKKIQDLAEEITAGCTTDYEKILALHDYIADNVNYDWDYFYGRNSKTYLVDIDVLNNKKSVCQGYCALFLSMARKLGIRSRVVDGWSKGSAYGNASWEDRLDGNPQSDHAWLEAYDSDDDRWIVLDITWDAPGKVGYGSVKGEVTGEDDPIMHRYFDITDEAFSYDHKTEKYEANGRG